MRAPDTTIITMDCSQARDSVSSVADDEATREERRLLDLHLERLQRSASELGFAVELDVVRSKLADIVMGRPESSLRVRLLLDRAGNVDVAAFPLPLPAPTDVMRYAISEHRVSSRDRLLAHKTTRRELYDREHALQSARQGVDEVLFLNERGELAEGSRTNIFVEREGRLLTPPVSAGLLPGTLRAALLADGRAVTGTLTEADLEAGATVYLGNSVRGLIRAERCR